MSMIFNVTNPELYIILVLSIINAGILLAVAYKFFQIIQLSGYRVSGFFSWLKKTKTNYLSRLIFLSLLSFGCLYVVNVLFSSFYISKYFSYIGLIFYFVFASVFANKTVTVSRKTPLKYTNRMVRLNVFFFIVATIFSLLLLALTSEFTNMLRFSIIAFTPISLLFLVPIVFYIELPLELLISNKYIRNAKKRLKQLEQIKPKIKIGITGSYGKTSTKVILDNILSEKYKVCSSPASFNTPMGLTKVILTQLKEDDEIIIAEMGARRLKDIKKLCKIITPDIAVITAIGEQHLNTFKTLEKLAQTKFEIVENAVSDAKVFMGSGEQIDKLFIKVTNEKYQAGLEKNKNISAHAEDVESSIDGTKFNLVIEDNKVKCVTKLLGIHNIENILLASLIAYKLGVSMDEIKKGILKVKSIPHRLELINAKNGVTILDDSYNASPNGARRALDVLKNLKANRKFVMTPGLVEQGACQFSSNFELGKEIGKVADFVILMKGFNEKSLYEGLTTSGFDSSKIFKAGSIKEAEEIMTKELKKGDVILIENDLPDNYL